MMNFDDNYESCEPITCEHCGGLLHDEEEQADNVCFDCWEANQQAAWEAEQAGADEKGYSEEAA